MFQYAHIELSNAVCNLSCSMCSVNGRRPGLIDTDTKIAFLQELQECNLMVPQFNLCIFGGEPLLCMDELCGLLRYTMQNSIRNCVVSNGTVLSEEKFTRLAESGLRDICISLDSHKLEIHNKMRNAPIFEAVTRNIQTVVALRNQMQYKIGVRTNILVNKLNLHELPDYIKFCKEILGVDSVNLIFIDKLYFGSDKVTFFDEVFIDDITALEKILYSVHQLCNLAISDSEIKYIIEYHRRVLGFPPDNSFRCELYNKNVILDSEGNFKLCFPFGAGSQKYGAYGDLKKYCIDKIPQKQMMVRNGKCNNNCFIKRYNLGAVLGGLC